MHNTSSIGIFTTDVSCVITSWNDWLERNTGLSEKAVYGRKVTEVIPDLEERGILEKFHKVATEGSTELLTPVFHHYLINIPLSNPAGHFSEMQQRVTISPLADEEMIHGVLVTIEDMTDQVLIEHEDSFLERVDELSSGDWMKRRDVAVSLSTAGKTIISEVLKKIRNEHSNLSILSSAMKVIAMSDEDVTDVLIGFLSDPDAELRTYSAQMLGEKNSAGVVDALLSVLDDQDVNVRYHSIESLGKLKAVKAAEKLASIALERDFFTSFPAIDALKSIGDQKSIIRLHPLIDDEMLGDSVIEAFASLGNPDIIPFLVGQVNKNTSRILPVVNALAQIAHHYNEIFGDNTFISDMSVAAFSHDGVLNLIACLDRASGNELTSLITVLGWIDDDEVRKALTRYLGHPDARRQVIGAFVSSGQKVVDILKAQLNGELEVRESAIIALGRIGGEKAAAALIPLLKDDDLAVLTCTALAKIGDSRAFNDLLELIGHENPGIRRAAIAALNSIGHPDTARRVKVLLSDKNPLVRESALRIAGYFGFQECKPVVQRLISDMNANVRIAAIENLPFFEDDRVISALRCLFDDPDPRIRIAVVKSLGQMESKLAWTLLGNALGDSDEWVRYYAVKSIDNQGYLDVMSRFKEIALNDPVPFVRLSAIEYLGHTGGQFAVTVLSSLTGDEDNDISCAAISALGDIHHPDAIAPLISLARSVNDETRRYAIEAIGRRDGPGTAGVLQWAALIEKDPEIRNLALKGLRAMMKQESVNALLNIAAYPENREKAICYLSSLPGEKISMVCEGLGHRHILVRTAVVEILLRNHTPQSSDMLAGCLYHSDPSVRLAAIYALHRLGNRKHIARLMSLKEEDPDPAVRKAVGELITEG